MRRNEGEKVEIWMNIDSGNIYLVLKELKTRAEYECVKAQVSNSHEVRVAIAETRQGLAFELSPTSFPKDLWPSMEDQVVSFSRAAGAQLHEPALGKTHRLFRDFWSRQLGFRIA